MSERSGDGDEVLEVLLPLGEVLTVDVTEHGGVEGDHLRHLLARRYRVGGDHAQHGREMAELLGVGSAARIRQQALRGLLHRGRRRQMAHQILRRPRPEPLEQQDHAVPRDRVARVRHDAQVRQDVLHVGRVEELEAAALDEGDVGALELELEV